jgi:hypothetical protein
VRVVEVENLLCDSCRTAHNVIFSVRGNPNLYRKALKACLCVISLVLRGCARAAPK